MTLKTAKHRPPTPTEPKITIRIIRECNFKCPRCITFSSPDGRGGKMSLALVRRIVDELASSDFRGQLNFSGGEPTLHPDLAPMLDYAARKLPFAWICLFTNGWWVGRRSWKTRLKSILCGKNVCARFSLDPLHAEGALLAAGKDRQKGNMSAQEARRMEQGRIFLGACLDLGAVPGVNVDFAFKGSIEEGRKYLRGLGRGPIPVYPIKFVPAPEKQAKTPGFMAVHAGPGGRLRAYPTLGHIPADEFLAGPEPVLRALRMNRCFLRRSKSPR